MHADHGGRRTFIVRVDEGGKGAVLEDVRRRDRLAIDDLTTLGAQIATRLVEGGADGATSGRPIAANGDAPSPAL